METVLPVIRSASIAHRHCHQARLPSSPSRILPFHCSTSVSLGPPPSFMRASVFGKGAAPRPTRLNDTRRPASFQCLLHVLQRFIASPRDIYGSCCRAACLRKTRRRSIKKFDHARRRCKSLFGHLSSTSRTFLPDAMAQDRSRCRLSSILCTVLILRPPMTSRIRLSRLPSRYRTSIVLASAISRSASSRVCGPGHTIGVSVARPQRSRTSTGINSSSVAGRRTWVATSQVGASWP